MQRRRLQLAGMGAIRDRCLPRVGIPLKADHVGKLSLTDMKNFVARRPVYTVLSTAKFTALTGVQPRHWRDAIAEYISAHVSKK